MDAFLQEGTITLPAINLNALSGVLRITGRSIPEHPVKFYQPVSDWLDSYIASSPTKILLNIHLDYLNTHSTECLLLLMKKIEAYGESSDSQVEILWNFDEDDEDMEILGEDLASLINVPFQIKEVVE